MLDQIGEMVIGRFQRIEIGCGRGLFAAFDDPGFQAMHGLAQHHRTRHARRTLQGMQGTLERIAHILLVRRCAPLPQHAADARQKFGCFLKEDRQQLLVEFIMRRGCRRMHRCGRNLWRLHTDRHSRCFGLWRSRRFDICFGFSLGRNRCFRFRWQHYLGLGFKHRVRQRQRLGDFRHRSREAPRQNAFDSPSQRNNCVIDMAHHGIA